jgi:hypothetical protein
MKKQNQLLFGQFFSFKQISPEVIPFIVFLLSFASRDITNIEDHYPTGFVQFNCCKQFFFCQLTKSFINLQGVTK